MIRALRNHLTIYDSDIMQHVRAPRIACGIERWWLARSRGRDIRRLKTVTASQDLGEYHSCSFDETALPLSTARIVHTSPHCPHTVTRFYYTPTTGCSGWMCVPKKVDALVDSFGGGDC